MAIEIRATCGQNGYNLILNHGYPLPSQQSIDKYMREHELSYPTSTAQLNTSVAKLHTAEQTEASGTENAKHVETTTLIDLDPTTDHPSTLTQERGGGEVENDVSIEDCITDSQFNEAVLEESSGSCNLGGHVDTSDITIGVSKGSVPDS